MKILLTNNTIIELRNCVIISNHPYYQRGIPKDLQARFEGKKIIKIKLDPYSKQSIASQVQSYTHNHTVLFKALRDDPNMVASEQKIAALTLLSSYRLKAGDGKIIDLVASDDPSVLEDPVFIQSSNFYADFQDKEEKGTLTSVDHLAHQMLRTPLPMVLSEVLDIYFKNHPKGHLEAYRSKVKLVWDKLIELIQDIPLVTLNRTLAKKYRDLRLEQTKGKVNKTKIKTTTVNREINQIKAVITTVIREEDLDITNPFESLTIAGLGEDADNREPFDVSELTTLLNACKENFDQTRKILTVQAFTGARISEIAGLRRKDFVEGDIPYITIKPYVNRSLKTKESKRSVPLVGLALIAVQEQIKTLSKDDIFLFPQYCKVSGVNGNAISATANKYIKSLGIDKTTHSLRHSMRDLLRDAQVTSDIAHEIGGWGHQVIGDRYGKGFSLAVKHNALSEAIKSIQINSKPIEIRQPSNDLTKASRASLKTPGRASKTKESASEKPSSTIAKINRKLGRKATAIDIIEYIKTVKK
jgi:integrase